MTNILLKNCKCCPRECGADRTVSTGYCGGNDKIRAARAALHFWEEPCISGEKGSGTVFFSGCSLRCVFCQNFNISSENFGKDISEDRFREILFELKEKGAHNINLVNPTHYVYQLADVLREIKEELGIPIVYNSGGYEKVSTLKMLDGIVDIYLPDFKYIDSNMSGKYSGAENYGEIAKKAIKEMQRQTGSYVLDKNGIMKKGTIVRHLVLPGGRKDSINIINWLVNNFSEKQIMVSIMSQYTPFFKSAEYKELNRKITKFEYDSVVDAVEESGFNGYIQQRDSANKKYTPEFDLTGI